MKHANVRISSRGREYNNKIRDLLIYLLPVSDVKYRFQCSNIGRRNYKPAAIIGSNPKFRDI